MIPLLGIWGNFKELPNEFDIKYNHGCGYNYVVQDKKKELLEGEESIPKVDENKLYVYYYS